MSVQPDLGGLARIGERLWREDRHGRFDDVMLQVGDQLVGGSVYRLLAEEVVRLFGGSTWLMCSSVRHSPPATTGTNTNTRLASVAPLTAPQPHRQPDPGLHQRRPRLAGT